VKPPPRLLDDPTLAPDVRSDLERTAATPYAYDAATGLTALTAAIGALPAAGASSAAAAAEAGAGAGAQTTAPAAKAAAWIASAGGKLALAATGAAVVVVGAIAWPRPAPERGARPATALHPSAPTRATPEPKPVTAPDAPAKAAREALAPAPTPAPDAIDRELAAIRARAERAGGSAADAALRREIDDLGRIKALLDSDPAQAYRLAQTGHREYRRGMLRHEREGLAVLALWNLDRGVEAATRARAFLARYPASPLAAEIERRLQAPERARAQESR
jgi:hypothetical protein